MLLPTFKFMGIFYNCNVFHSSVGHLDINIILTFKFMGIFFNVCICIVVVVEEDVDIGNEMSMDNSSWYNNGGA